MVEGAVAPLASRRRGLRDLRKTRGTLFTTEEAAATLRSDTNADLTNSPSLDRMKSKERSKGGRLPRGRVSTSVTMHIYTEEKHNIILCWVCIYGNMTRGRRTPTNHSAM